MKIYKPSSYEFGFYSWLYVVKHIRHKEQFDAITNSQWSVLEKEFTEACIRNAILNNTLQLSFVLLTVCVIKLLPSTQGKGRKE